MDKDERLNEYIKEESLKDHFSKVFDERTVLAVHWLAKRGYLDKLESVVSEGKEAVVFRGTDKNNRLVAVKIYKIETSSFRKMQDYLDGDQRFRGIAKNKKDVVYAWTKKEFKNLEIAANAGLSVPLPFAYRENCLVMEFIGKEKNCKIVEVGQLRDNPPKDAEDAYWQVVSFIAGLYNAGLVHADLSEYNILNKDEKLVVIDIGQGVPKSHPMAEKFFERDLENLSRYFTKQGLSKSAAEMRIDVKKAAGTKE